MKTIIQIKVLAFCCLAFNVLGGPLSGPVSVPPAAVEFVENRGQWPRPVQFAAALVAGQLFLEPRSFTYVLTEARPHAHAATASPEEAAPAVPRRGHAYRVHFEGARAEASARGELPTGLFNNYLRGNDSTAWARHVPSFRAVQYAQLYPHTGLRVYENSQQQLEYTFTVQPGGVPTAIRLRYEGTNGLALDGEGNLRIATSAGPVTELAPRAWQTNASGQQVAVPCAFVLEESTVSFRLGAYDRTRPLVIDPVVLFATFTGAQADNWGHTATHDAQGNLYSAGTVFAAGYPTSPGAFDPSFNGSVDVAIIKYHTGSSGNAARAYATYLGGSETDVPHRVVVDGQGELIVLGTTSSADFPVNLRSFGRQFRGGPAITPENGITYRRGADLFVARLRADGQRLVGSTYLAGSGTDGLPFATFRAASQNQLPQMGAGAWRGDVQLDADGNVYVASSTASADFPARTSFQTTYQRGVTDAVVCRLSPDLQQLQWSAFLGGAAADAAFSLTLAPNGLVYVGGASKSPNLPVTIGALRPAASGGADGFVAAIDRDGQALRYLCRTGTAQDDAVEFVQADANSAVYVAGLTRGNFPASAGSPSTGQGGILMQQFSSDLSSTAFTATVPFGSWVGLTFTAFRADACGQLYLATVGRTTGLPVTEGLRPAFATYVARFSAQARSLDFAACYGGDHSHGLSHFDAGGILYQAVCGNCRGSRGDFPLPPQANFYTRVSGSANCNDASLKIAVAPDANTSYRQLCSDAGPLPLGGSPAGGAWSGPGVSAAPGGGFRFSPGPALLGDNTLSYLPPSGSSCAGSRLVVRVVAPAAVTISPIGGPFCGSQGPNVPLVAQPAGGEFSGPGVSFGYFSPALAGPGTHTITYNINLSGQCGTGTRTVTVLGTVIRVAADTALCGPPYRPYQLQASPAGGTWSGVGVSTTGWFNPAALGSITQATWAQVSYTFTGPDGCPSRAAPRILLVPNPLAVTPLRLPACPLRPDIVGIAPYTLSLPSYSPNDYAMRGYWDFGDGQTSEQYTGNLPPVTYIYAQAGTFTPVLHIEYLPGACPRIFAMAPVIIGEPQALPNIITPNGDGLNDFLVQREFCELPALRVFSRWGQEVYRAEQYRNDWAAPGLPAGTYYYRFVGEQGRTAKGWLEVRP